MKAERAAFAEAAKSCVGCQFKLHGRDPAMGIDCVGLVLWACKAIHRHPPPVERYALRNTRIDQWLPLFDLAGFAKAKGTPITGDVAMLRPSPGQFHFGITTSPERFVHAHAGLRRVVISPMPQPSDPVGLWRLI